MRRKSKSKSDWIYEKLEEIHKDVKEVRENDIPNIKTDIEVVKVKSSMQAKIVSAIGGIIAVSVSAAIALIR